MSKGTRLSPDWQPSDSERSYAIMHGLSGERLSRVIEDFRDYWISSSGARATKNDWSATWRMWCRREADKNGNGYRGSSGFGGRGGGGGGTSGILELALDLSGDQAS